MLLTHLETLASVARLQSFTRAAAELNLSQPAVTQHVAALESRMGSRLLERRGREVTLTPAGEQVLACHQQVAANLRQLDRDLDALRGGQQGQLAVGAGLTICIFTLPALLARYRLRHRGVDLHVRSGRTREVLALVLDRQVDVGLVTSPVAHRLVDTFPLYNDRMVVVARPDHPLAGQVQPVDAAALGAHRLILFERGSGFRAYLEEVFESKGVLLRPDMELDSIEAIKEMVLAGLGISVIPEVAIAGELANGSLVAVPLRDWPVMERTTSLITRHEPAALPVAAAAFVRLLKEEYPPAHPG